MAAKSNVVKNLPASENGRGILCATREKEQYVVSHDLAKDKLTLWKVVPEGYEKIKAGADSPFELYDLIPAFRDKSKKIRGTRLGASYCNHKVISERSWEMIRALLSKMRLTSFSLSALSPVDAAAA